MTCTGGLEFPRGTWIEELVSQSLREDVGDGDVSTALSVSPQIQASGRIIAREEGVMAGLPLLEILYEQLAAEVGVELLVADGAQLQEFGVGRFQLTESIFHFFPVIIFVERKFHLTCVPFFREKVLGHTQGNTHCDRKDNVCFPGYGPGKHTL